MGAKLEFISSFAEHAFMKSLKPGWSIWPLLGKVFDHLLERETCLMTEPGCSEGDSWGGREKAEEGDGEEVPQLTLDLQRPVAEAFSIRTENSGGRMAAFLDAAWLGWWELLRKSKPLGKSPAIGRHKGEGQPLSRTEPRN